MHVFFYFIKLAIDMHHMCSWIRRQSSWERACWEYQAGPFHEWHCKIRAALFQNLVSSAAEVGSIIRHHILLKVKVSKWGGFAAMPYRKTLFGSPKKLSMNRTIFFPSAKKLFFTKEAFIQKLFWSNAALYGEPNPIMHCNELSTKKIIHRYKYYEKYD